MRTESRASAKAKRKRPHVSRTDEAEGSADAQADAGRKARADKAAALQASEPSAADLKREREGLQARARGGAEEWAKASQRRSVNDVAQAPPTFTKLPRGASAEALARKAAARAALLGEDPEEAARETKKRKDANVSAAQRQALQEERERVVKKYRQLKEGKIREREEREAVKKGGRRKAAGGNDE